MVVSLLLAALLGTVAAARQEADDELREFCPLYRVFFDEGSAHLGADDLRVIDNWIAFARATHSPDNRFTIEAGTDAEGSAIANLNLSWRRGRAIMNYLQSRGFPPGHIRIRAMGESRQVWMEPGASDGSTREQNRMAILILETSVNNWRRHHGDLIC